MLSKNLASLIFWQPFAQMGQIASIFSKGIPSYYKTVVIFGTMLSCSKEIAYTSQSMRDIGKVGTVERAVGLETVPRGHFSHPTRHVTLSKTYHLTNFQSRLLGNATLG